MVLASMNLGVGGNSRVWLGGKSK